LQRCDKATEAPYASINAAERLLLSGPVIWVDPLSSTCFPSENQSTAIDAYPFNIVVAMSRQVGLRPERPKRQMGNSTGNWLWDLDQMIRPNSASFYERLIPSLALQLRCDWHELSLDVRLLLRQEIQQKCQLELL